MNMLIMTTLVFSQITEISKMQHLIAELKANRTSVKLPDHAEYWNAIARYRLLDAKGTEFMVNLFVEDSDLTAIKESRKYKLDVINTTRPNYLAIHAIYRKNGRAERQYRLLFAGGRVAFDRVREVKKSTVTMQLRANNVVVLGPGASEEEFQRMLRMLKDQPPIVKKLVIVNGIPTLK